MNVSRDNLFSVSCSENAVRKTHGGVHLRMRAHGSLPVYIKEMVISF